MPHLILPGVDLWYEDTGGSDTPVIFLHAASGTTESRVHQLPASTIGPPSVDSGQKHLVQ